MLEELERLLEYRFKNRRLLLQAVTRRTWVEENRSAALELELDPDAQQRLEFLGDGVLGFIVGHELFLADPTATPGALTKRRARLVSNAHLERVGEVLGVERFAQMGDGDDKDRQGRGRLRRETVEATLGAILLDRGLDELRPVAWRLVHLVQPRDPELNPISAYNERWQRAYGESPPPIVTGACDDGRQATVTLPGGSTVKGTGSSNQVAKAAACRQALEAWSTD